MTLFYIIAATFIVSLGGLIGVFTLSIKEKTLHKFLNSLVAISAGAMMATAFLHLLPEAAESIEPTRLFPMILIAFLIFLLIEKVLHWRHCHEGHCEVHTFGYMNLIGDAIHNFIDGLIIAAAFLTSTQLGVVTTIAVCLHEIPQEISDFGVLVYSGFKKQKAIMLNFLVALTSVLGGIVGYLAAPQAKLLAPYLLVFAAGSFLYISASDLIPELRSQNNRKTLVTNFILIIVGILIIYSLNTLKH